MKLKSLLNVVYGQALRQHCVKHTQSCGGNPIGPLDLVKQLLLNSAILTVRCTVAMLDFYLF